MQSDMGREAAYGEYRPSPSLHCLVLLPQLTTGKGKHCLVPYWCVPLTIPYTFISQHCPHLSARPNAQLLAILPPI